MSVMSDYPSSVLDDIYRPGQVVRKKVPNSLCHKYIWRFMPYMKKLAGYYCFRNSRCTFNDLVAVGKISIWHTLQCLSTDSEFFKPNLLRRIRFAMIALTRQERNAFGLLSSSAYTQTVNNIRARERELGRELTFTEQVASQGLLTKRGALTRMLNFYCEHYELDELDSTTESMFNKRESIEERLNFIVDFPKYQTWIKKLYPKQRRALSLVLEGNHIPASEKALRSQLDLGRYTMRKLADLQYDYRSTNLSPYLFLQTKMAEIKEISNG